MKYEIEKEKDLIKILNADYDRMILYFLL